MNIDDRTKLFAIIARTLEISADRVSEDLAAGSIPQWDSLGHLGLISAIEEGFDVSFDVDELFEVETVGDFIELLDKEAG